MSSWARLQLERSLGGYVILGSHVLLDKKLTDGAVRMFGLMRLIGRNKVEFTATQKELAEFAGVSSRTVDRHLEELVGAGLVGELPVPRRGKSWTFLPPNTARMATTFATVLDTSVRSPSASLPTQGGRARRRGLGSTADQALEVEDNGGNEEVDEDTGRPAPASRPLKTLDLLGLETTAAVMVVMMRREAVARLGLKGRRELLVPQDLFPWLRAGVEPERVLAAWSEYVAHFVELVGENGDEDFDRWYGIHETFMGAAASRRVMDDFADWVLSGAELAEPQDRMRLPVDQLLDIKEAAADLRRRAPRERPTPTTLTIELEDVDWLSVTALGMDAMLRASTSLGVRTVAWGHAAPWLPLVHAVAVASGPKRLESLPTLIRGADELLDLGVWKPEADGQPDGAGVGIDEDAPCASPVIYHRAKHSAWAEQRGGCARCRACLTLTCHDDAEEAAEFEPAVLHCGEVLCAPCTVDAAAEDDLIEIPPCE
ncbi:MAG: hypothetical protein WCD35_19620 [Mycobacteriales bacterium]